MFSFLTRRNFLQSATAAAGAFGLAARPAALTVSESSTEKLALLGGKPVRTGAFPSWPVIGSNDETSLLDVLHRLKWNRWSGTYVSGFEKAWAQMLGAKYCLATASGTSALITALTALDVGPGDEVIVPPYTFVATINAVLMVHALPVFVDTDRETMQIDARKIEAAITPRTRCLLPVHIGGSAADLDTVLAVARKHKLFVIEDACQSHLAEWRHNKVSTLGDFGCFSFQASKNLNSGEGGAVMSNNEQLMEIARSVHTNGSATSRSSGFSYERNGANFRLTEFQGAILGSQLSRLEEQSRVRERNAQYLTAQLREIPGLQPARMYEGCTRNNYLLYMMHYDPQAFAGLPRAKFLKALHAEGIPASPGYSPLTKEPFLKNTLDSRGFRAIYPAKELSAYAERNQCPVNDKLCEEAVWFTQNMLLGTTRDMDQITEAVRKIQKNAALLKG